MAKNCKHAVECFGSQEQCLSQSKTMMGLERFGELGVFKKLQVVRNIHSPDSRVFRISWLLSLKSLSYITHLALK